MSFSPSLAFWLLIFPPIGLGISKVAIVRSEIDTAESVNSPLPFYPRTKPNDNVPQNLNSLISHTRTTHLFRSHSALITLHYVHLVHAVGRTAKMLLHCCLSGFFFPFRSWGGGGGRGVC